MEKRKTIKIDIKDIITLCHILNEYKVFNKNLINFLRGQRDKIETIYKLGKVSNGEKCFASIKIHKFYRDNKLVIDTINKFSNIQSYICQNYQFGWGKEPVEYKNYSLFKYIVDNRDKIDKILAVLEKLKELGFEALEFNPTLDFTTESYTLNTFSNHNSHITYLDNLEVIPSYQKEIVKYKSNGSNYKMVLGLLYSAQEFSHYDIKIVLNDLTFDADRLPTALSREQIVFRIIGLQNDKKEEYTAIINSVDLSIGVNDLLSMFNEVNEMIISLNDVNKKEELIQLLLEIKERILKMQSISSEYDKEVSANTTGITESLLDAEKKAYQRRREFSRMHLD